MSQKMKVALTLVLAVVVLGGLYYWYRSTKPDAAPVALETETPAPTGPTLPSGNDTSDASLEMDVSSVDADVQAMAGDTAAIDSGLNDKEVTQ